MTTLRKATNDDWRKFWGIDPIVPWQGYVAEDQHMILGIGGLFMPNDGRWHAFLKKAPGVRAVLTTYKAALLTLDDAEQQGLTVYAMPDDGISSACAFLKRFGFVETEEKIDGLTYWKRLAD